MVAGSIGFASMSIASLMTGWLSYSRGRPYYQLESAIYAGTHRCFWAAGVAWFIIADGTTGFGKSRRKQYILSIIIEFAKIIIIVIYK